MLSSEQQVLFYNSNLNIENANVLSITSDSVNIEVSFSDKNIAQAIVKAPRGTNTSIIDIKATTKGNICYIAVDSSDPRVHSSAFFTFPRAQNFVELSIKTSTGDVKLNSCKIRKVEIDSENGDIVIANHCNPCKMRAKSNNGDVVCTKKYQKSTTYFCTCNTKNGDVTIC